MKEPNQVVTDNTRPNPETQAPRNGAELASEINALGSIEDRFDEAFAKVIAFENLLIDQFKVRDDTGTWGARLIDGLWWIHDDLTGGLKRVEGEYRERCKGLEALLHESGNHTRKPALEVSREDRPESGPGSLAWEVLSKMVPVIRLSPLRQGLGYYESALWFVEDSDVMKVTLAKSVELYAHLQNKVCDDVDADFDINTRVKWANEVSALLNSTN